jgi:hypothetical protein
LAFGGNVEKRGGDEVGGFEDLEITSGGEVVFGTVDDGLGRSVPGDFLEGEGVAEEILGEALEADVVSPKNSLSLICAPMDEVLKCTALYSIFSKSSKWASVASRRAPWIRAQAAITRSEAGTGVPVRRHALPRRATSTR